MTFQQFVTDHRITIEAAAIPFRSGIGADMWGDDSDKREHIPPIHFVVTLRQGHRVPIWQGEYSCGAASPVIWAQKARKTRDGLRGLARLSFDQHRELARLPVSAWGSESLSAFELRRTLREIFAERAPLEAWEILESLSMEWKSVDSAYCDGFEDWAANMGAHPDSRKAESTFRHIQETAARARRALGRERFAELIAIESE